VKILVLNGPNLAALGRREPDVYGTASLAELDAACVAWGAEHGAEVTCAQSNDEGALIDRLYAAEDDGVAGVVFNAGGYTHTSVALRDAIAAIDVPVLEVHLSNVHAREAFRRESLIAPVCRGSIAGLGPAGYRAAIEAFARGVGA